MTLPLVHQNVPSRLKEFVEQYNIILPKQFDDPEVAKGFLTAMVEELNAYHTITSNASESPKPRLPITALSEFDSDETKVPSIPAQEMIPDDSTHPITKEPLYSSDPAAPNYRLMLNRWSQMYYGMAVAQAQIQDRLTLTDASHNIIYDMLNTMFISLAVACNEIPSWTKSGSLAWSSLNKQQLLHVLDELLTMISNIINNFEALKDMRAQLPTLDRNELEDLIWDLKKRFTIDDITKKIYDTQNIFKDITKKAAKIFTPIN